MSQYLFIGGSGRSGTSFLAKKMSELPTVIGIEDVELKIFGELNGLPDLHHALVSHYGLQRAKNAVNSFRKLYLNLFSNFYLGQVELGTVLDAQQSTDLVDAYLAGLTNNDRAYPLEITHQEFVFQTKRFIDALYDDLAGVEKYHYRLEKTPHNLLQTRFLSELFHGSKFVHVSRDPRAVAVSLLKMPWGPDNIDECVRWYASYHNSWMREKAHCDLSGIEIYDFRIEDFHHEESATVSGLSEYLQMEQDLDLSGFNYEKLIDLSGKITDEQFSELNDGLQKEVSELGYDANSVGSLA